MTIRIGCLLGWRTPDICESVEGGPVAALVDDFKNCLQRPKKWIRALGLPRSHWPRTLQRSFGRLVAISGFVQLPFPLLESVPDSLAVFPSARGGGHYFAISRPRGGWPSSWAKADAAKATPTLSLHDVAAIAATPCRSGGDESADKDTILEHISTMAPRARKNVLDVHV